jgi:hypothetical protein
MSSTCQAVQIFISFTFRDMQTEKNHLNEVVLPKLIEWTKKFGLKFFDVDLRRGIRVKDHNIETDNFWEYCRQWIDRIEPLIVCILGQRYGWVPELRYFRTTTIQLMQLKVLTHE